MAKVVREELVCEDCYMVINGYRVEGHDVEIKGTWYPVSDDNEGFSWSPCGLCKRPEGGARYKVIELKP